MTPKTILVPVDVKDRLPKRGGLYWVIDPNGVHGEVKVSAIFQLHTEKWVVLDSGTGDTIHPSVWLEEVELPDEEMILKEARNNEVSGGEINTRLYRDGILYGAKHILNLIFKK